MNVNPLLCVTWLLGTPLINSWMVALAASAITFAVTNVDDLILLTALFASRVPARRVVAGQYLGFAAIVLVSALGIWATVSIPHRWIHALGILPILIAVKQLAGLVKGTSGERRIINMSSVSIAIATFANGADNIALYVPFFVVARKYLWLTFVTYAVLVAFWCLIARTVGSLSFVLRKVEQVGHWMIPLVLLVLGVYILAS
jgi:cadmium resistance protein CadD (predicted permease)